MSFTSILAAWIEAGKPVDNDLMTYFKDNFDFLNAASSGAVSYDIPNGDMEITDASFPANWASTTYPGGTAGLETTAPINGSQSMLFTHPGGASNGGGYADSDYLPCGENAPFRVSWLHKATAAGMKNQVYIRWFDEDKVFISATTIYESTDNPTTETQFSNIANPVSGARFWRVRPVGGFTDTDVAGDAIFDGFAHSKLGTRTYTFSAAADVEILDVRDCQKLRITLRDVVPSTTASIGLVVSADNGSTYVTTAVYASPVADNANTTSFNLSDIRVYTALATTGSLNGDVIIENMAEAKYTLSTTDIRNIDSTTPTLTSYKTHSAINTTTAYNAIKLRPSTGTFTGTIIVEELF